MAENLYLSDTNLVKNYYARVKDGEYQKRFTQTCKLKRKGREKSKHTKSITNAFNQKWLNEQKNKEDK